MEKTSGENLHQLYTELGDLKGDFRNYNLYRFILKRVRGKSILDIGCGAGHFLGLAKSKGFATSGIEENAELIKLSQEIYGADLGIKQGRVENLSSLDKKFDSIVLIDVLEHIEDDSKALELITKKLNKAGRVVILVPAYQFLYGKRDKNIGHYRRYTKGALVKKMKKAGLEIVEARYWNMLGVVPYYIAEKIMKKEFIVGFRGKKKKGFAGKMLNKTLFKWFDLIENPLNAGFGLSVVVVGKLL